MALALSISSSADTHGAIPAPIRGGRQNLCVALPRRKSFTLDPFGHAFPQPYAPIPGGQILWYSP